MSDRNKSDAARSSLLVIIASLPECSEFRKTMNFGDTDAVCATYRRLFTGDTSHGEFLATGYAGNYEGLKSIVSGIRTTVTTGGFTGQDVFDRLVVEIRVLSTMKRSAL